MKYFSEIANIIRYVTINNNKNKAIKQIELLENNLRKHGDIKEADIIQSMLDGTFYREGWSIKIFGENL